MVGTRSAIVTGSTSGIGAAIAESLASAGVNVMLNGFGEAAEIEAQRARLAASHPANVVYHAADMRNADEIADLCESATREFGRVDILVNNAGVQHVSPLEDFPAKKWDEIIAVNLSSAFHTSRCLLAGMKDRGWGRIVNIASAHGLAASPFKSAYVAAKHGLVGLTKTIALEAAESGVTVNAVCPGYVRTPLVERQIPDTARARGITEEEVVRDVILQAQPTKRFVRKDHLAELVLFLCSDAGESITGAALSIDGGWTAK